MNIDEYNQLQVDKIYKALIQILKDLDVRTRIVLVNRLMDKYTNDENIELNDLFKKVKEANRYK